MVVCSVCRRQQPAVHPEPIVLSLSSPRPSLLATLSWLDHPRLHSKPYRVCRNTISSPSSPICSSFRLDDHGVHSALAGYLTPPFFRSFAGQPSDHTYEERQSSYNASDGRSDALVPLFPLVFRPYRSCSPIIRGRSSAVKIILPCWPGKSGDLRFSTSSCDSLTETSIALAGLVAMASHASSRMVILGPDDPMSLSGTTSKTIFWSGMLHSEGKARRVSSTAACELSN
jgi:hypothetical protein